MEKEKEHKEDHKNEAPGQNKEYAIIVNGRQKVVTTKELSFDEVVALAFDNPPTGQNIVFTVTYRRGEGNKPEGTLVEGGKVKIKEGIIFNVTATDKS
ncbi:MAG: multiubiquitin domain-containing protein [Nitrospirae bacterium]|nr:multiubiquitin domain-containing protein [Nitrospirota bacterium]